MKPTLLAYIFPFIKTTIKIKNYLPDASTRSKVDTEKMLQFKIGTRCFVEKLFTDRQNKNTL